MTNTIVHSKLEMNIPPARARLRQIGHFMIVGLLSTLIDFSLFAALNGWLGLPTLAANTIAYSAGIVNGYLLNRRWTFSAAPRKAVAVQFAQFAVVSLAALGLNSLMVLLLTPTLNMLIAPLLASLLAKAIATGVCLGWNFSFNYFWTFRINEWN